MNRHTKNGVIFYTFDLFDKYNIKHCFSTRHGGVSKGFYESMNLSFTRGDEKDNVTENFTRLCNAAGFDANDLVFSDQVHKTCIYKASAADRGKGIYRENDICDMDGLMTGDESVVLTTFYADCVPLYFFDKENRVIALSHAGWKGTLAEMVAKTVLAMDKEYGSRPQDIIAGIGPSICGDCYEVGEDVSGLFSELTYSGEFIKAAGKNGKYYIDLPAINRQSLLNAGIPYENIEMSGLCTLHSGGGSEFYSHRASGANRGSLAAFISL